MEGHSRYSDRMPDAYERCECRVRSARAFEEQRVVHRSDVPSGAPCGRHLPPEQQLVDGVHRQGQQTFVGQGNNQEQHPHNAGQTEHRRDHVRDEKQSTVLGVDKRKLKE